MDWIQMILKLMKNKCSLFSVKRSKQNKAIKADNKFVSRYADNFPKREDIA